MAKVDGLDWIAPSYELRDYGNTVSVACIINNTSDQIKTIHLDWVLVVDGQQYPPKDIVVLMGQPPASIGEERSIAGGGADLLWVLFDTPPGRGPDQDAKAFMQDRDVMIFWPSFNTQIKLGLH